MSREDDEDDEDEDREPYDPDADRPQPACCAEGASYIRAHYHGLYCESAVDFDAVIATPPDWSLALICPGMLQWQRLTKIVSCPWCATKLPALRRKQGPALTITRIEDGGYYCASCEERLMGCRCRTPEALWEVMP